MDTFFCLLLLSVTLLTRLVIVEHEEEVDQPGQLHRLEHLSNEAQLAEVYYKPGLLFSNLPEGKTFHGWYEILGTIVIWDWEIFSLYYYLFGQHVILQLNIEGSSVLGVHHQEAEVQGLLGSPSDPLHIVPESLLQRGHVWVELSWRGDDFNKAAICKEHQQLSSESTEMFLPRCFWNCFWTSELIW